MTDMKQPDPTPGELRLKLAGKAYGKAAAALEQHEGPRQGSEYALKLDAWHDAGAELMRAARELAKETLDAA